MRFVQEFHKGARGSLSLWLGLSKVGVYSWSMTTWKQERPSWCPHSDCLFVRRAMDAMCVGHLPEPIAHDGDFNQHRWCLNGTSDTGGVFDLQINDTDLWWFRHMFSALDGK